MVTPRRGRSPLIQWTWLVAFLAVLYWGAGAVGVPIEGFRLGFPPREVRLTAAVPPTVHSRELALSGSTQPNALVTAIVDGSRLPFALAGDDGAFNLTVDVGGLGVHRIRIEVAYGPPDHPDELLDFSITRVPDILPTPTVIAVQQLTDPNSFVVLLRSTPRTTIIPTGATATPARPRIDDSGRAQIRLQLAPPTTTVTLSAGDDQGGMSLPTAPLDLATLSEKPVSSPPFERADWTVSYELNRDGVTRTQAVVVDKHRQEVTDFARGAIGAATFVRAAGGVAGLAPSGNFGCLDSSVRPAHSELEIGDRAKVTVTDDFPDILTAWNGLTDRPRISLCFPAGFPGMGNTGTIELKVRDFSVVSVTEQLESVSVKTLDTGQVERTYTWSSVPRSGAIDISLALDTPSMLASLPTIRPRTVIADEGLGPLFLGVIDALIHGAGVLLLLWWATSRLARFHVPPAPRRALAGVLTLGAALMFLPAFGELQALGNTIANYSTEVLNVAGQIHVAPSIVGRWVFALLILGFLLAAARIMRNRVEFVSRASLAIAGGAGGWLFISGLGWIIIHALAAPSPEATIDEVAVRIVTWIVGALGLTFVVFVAGGQFGTLLADDDGDDMHDVDRGIGRIARLGWSAVLGLLLALPAGTGQKLPTTPENAASYVEGTLTGLAGLVAFAYPLVAITAVAFLVRAAWKWAAWEQTPPFQRQVGRALFAGFVIGTAGVLLPIPFVLAFVLFPLMLRSRPEVARLFHSARRLRGERTTIVAALLGDTQAADRLELLGSSKEPGPAELGPEPTEWGSVRLALLTALVLEIPLLLVYIARYPFASMTNQDEFFIQRLVLNIVTFAGTWLTIALVFALLYVYLKGTTGVRKGIWFGLMILALTVPWQLLSGLATTISPVGIGIHVLEVVTFTGLIGAVFDLRLLQLGARVQFGRPRQLLRDVGVVSGLPDLAAAVALVAAAVATTALSLITGQVTQLLTRVLSPFLPVPPGGP